MGDWRIDLVRASYDAFAASDADALVPLYDPECVFDFGPAGAAMPQREWHGPDGLRGILEEFRATASSMVPSIVELRSNGEDVLVRLRARVGVEHDDAPIAVDQAFGQVITFRARGILRATLTDDPPPGWADATPLA